MAGDERRAIVVHIACGLMRLGEPRPNLSDEHTCCAGVGATVHCQLPFCHCCTTQRSPAAFLLLFDVLSSPQPAFTAYHASTVSLST